MRGLGRQHDLAEARACRPIRAAASAGAPPRRRAAWPAAGPPRARSAIAPGRARPAVIVPPPAACHDSKNAWNTSWTNWPSRCGVIDGSSLTSSGRSRTCGREVLERALQVPVDRGDRVHRAGGPGPRRRGTPARPPATASARSVQPRAGVAGHGPPARVAATSAPRPRRPASSAGSTGPPPRRARQLLEQRRRIDDRVVLERERGDRHVPVARAEQQVDKRGPRGGQACRLRRPAELGQQERRVEDVAG